MAKLEDFCANRNTIIKRKCLPDTSLILPDRLVGIEIEMEDYPYPRTDSERHDPMSKDLAEFWTMKTDGSLRGNAREYVSQPIMGSDIIAACEMINKQVARHSKHITFGVRTSVHVHVDVRDIDVAQLQSILYTHILFERFILEQLFPTRKDNVFCIPIHAEQSYQSSIKKIMSVLSNSDEYEPVTDANKAIRQALSSIKGRYTGLNLLAINKYATLEFRHSKGTAKAKEIIDWINFIFGIIKSKDWSPDFIYDNILDGAGGIERIIDTLYGSNSDLIHRHKNYMDSLLKGAKDLTYILNMRKYPKIKNPCELKDSLYYSIRASKIGEKQKDKKSSQFRGTLWDAERRAANLIDSLVR